jgi:hypothetical protein
MHGAVVGVLCEMVRSENARRVACNRGGMLDQQLLRCCDATAVANLPIDVGRCLVVLEQRKFWVPSCANWTALHCTAHAHLTNTKDNMRTKIAIPHLQHKSSQVISKRVNAGNVILAMDNTSCSEADMIITTHLPPSYMQTTITPHSPSNHLPSTLATQL